MGNSLGGKRSAKVMKINGETFKLRTPIQAGAVVDNHPGHVVLESEAVKQYGVRAKPLEPHQELKPKRLYFLVELPKFPAETGGVRRVRSGIQMSAKDRLDTLMLKRRSASDLSIMRPPVSIELEEEKVAGIVSQNGGGGGVRVRVRLPKAEVERLMAESKDGADVAEKLVGLCIAGGGAAAAPEKNVNLMNEHGSVKRAPKSREKRVGFMPINEGEIHIGMAS